MALCACHQVHVGNIVSGWAVSTSEETIFASALSKPAGVERAEYLAEACHEDAALHARVEELLAAHGEAGVFLEAPPPDLSALAEDARDDDTAESANTQRRIGPYHLIEQIGEGGMGVVFRAEQLEPV